MITSFRHKGLEGCFRTGSLAGVQAIHVKRLRQQLTALSVAHGQEDLGNPAWRLHRLVGDRAGFYAMTVQANWRTIFRFDVTDVELVDYLDNH